MHSYCVSFVQPGPGFHVQSGRPGKFFSRSMAACTSSGLRGAIFDALIGLCSSSIGVFVPITSSSQMHLS